MNGIIDKYYDSPVRGSIGHFYSPEVISLYFEDERIPLEIIETFEDDIEDYLEDKLEEEIEKL